MSPKVKSAIITLFVVALFMCLMFVVSGYRYVPPIPPPPEEGVEVSLGNSDFGYGQSPEPASEATNYAPPAAQQQVATQRTPSIPVPASPTPGNITNPAAEQQPVVENKEPEINKNALFPGKRNQTTGNGSKGDSQGQGSQGKPDGNPNSNNFSGQGGGSGNFSLKGRSAVSLPKPEYNSNMQGNVVVRIWVNQRGEVTRVEAPYKGSTITAGRLVEQAKAAARRARFNASTDAPEEQIGTITYMFKI